MVDAPSLLRSTTADSIESADGPQPRPRRPLIALIARCFAVAAVALCISRSLSVCFQLVQDADPDGSIYPEDGPDGVDLDAPYADGTDGGSQGYGRLGETPRIIHKVLFCADNICDPTPAYIHQAHQNWRALNPGYDLRLYDLARAHDELERHGLHHVSDAMRMIRAESGKSNLFRLGILLIHGGFYSDWKQECLVPNLLSALSAHRLVACKDMGKGDNPNTALYAKNYQTSFIGARPGEPCIRRALNAALRHVRAGFYGQTPLDTTGPGLWGRVLTDHCISHEPAAQPPPHVAPLSNHDGSAIAERDMPRCWFEESTSETDAAGKALTYFHLNASATQQWLQTKPSKRAGPLASISRLLLQAESGGGLRVVRHKCKRCGQGQDSWGSSGNDYGELWRKRRYYVERAWSWG